MEKQHLKYIAEASFSVDIFEYTNNKKLYSQIEKLKLGKNMIPITSDELQEEKEFELIFTILKQNFNTLYLDMYDNEKLKKNCIKNDIDVGRIIDVSKFNKAVVALFCDIYIYLNNTIAAKFLFLKENFVLPINPFEYKMKTLKYYDLSEQSDEYLYKVYNINSKANLESVYNLFDAFIEDNEDTNKSKEEFKKLNETDDEGISLYLQHIAFFVNNKCYMDAFKKVRMNEYIYMEEVQRKEKREKSIKSFLSSLD